jgi:hypothetical protein
VEFVAQASCLRRVDILSAPSSRAGWKPTGRRLEVCATDSRRFSNGTFIVFNLIKFFFSLYFQPAS